MRRRLTKKLRWLVLAALARKAVRGATRRQLDKRTSELENKLPAPVKRAADALPVDVVRVGGSALLAGQTMRSAVGASQSLSPHKLMNRKPRVGIFLGRQSLGESLSAEIENARREMTADRLGIVEGEAAATESLLDLRQREVVPLPETPDPIGGGRSLAPINLVQPTITRMKRTYRQPTKPWDRPSIGR